MTIEWIPVGERLPDYNVEVLGICMGWSSAYAFTVHRVKTIGWFDTRRGTNAPAVTHWMPLPEPPKT